MFSSIYMAFANIKKRKLQSSLIALTMVASVMLLSTSLAIVLNTQNIYDRASEELDSSQVYIYSIAKFHPYNEAVEYWEDKEGISPLFMKYILYSDAIQHYDSKEKSSVEIKPGFCIVPLSKRLEGQDQIKIVEGEDKKRPDKGEIWLPTGIAYANKLKLNDILTFESDGKTRELKVSAIFVDPPFSAPLNGLSETFISFSDLSFFGKYESTDYLIKLKFEDYSIADETLIEWEEDLGHPFIGNVFKKEQFKNLGAFITNIASSIMMVTAIILTIVVVLVIIYSVSSDIFGDYKTIGVLMALGFSKRATRRVYMLQYALIYLFAIVIALFGSGHLTNMILNTFFLKSLGFNGLSLNMILPFAIVAVLSLLIVFFTVYFVARSAAHVNPVEAITIGNAKTKNRNRAKSSKLVNKLSSVGMLIMKSFFEKKGQNIFVIFMAALVISTTLLITNATRPMQDPKIFREYSGLGQEDVNIQYSIEDEDVAEDIFNKLKTDSRVEEFLQITSSTQGAIVKQEGVSKSSVLINILGYNVNDTNYPVPEGKNPAGNDEVAISTVLSKLYNKTIGDQLKIFLHGEEKKLTITGIFSSTENLGYCIRVAENLISDIDDTFSPDTFKIVLKDKDKEQEFIDKYNEISGVKSITSINDEIKKISESVLSGVNTAIIVVNAVLWGILLIILFNVMTLNVIREKKSLGILQTIGFTPLKTKMTLISPILITSFAGIIIGIILVSTVGRTLLNGIYATVGVTECPYLITPADLAILTVCYLGFVLISTYIPARNILKISPRDLIIE